MSAPAHRIPFLPRAALLALSLSFACVQGAQPPNVAPSGTLAPGDPNGGAEGAAGPLAVVFGAPRGETVSPSEVSLVFNRPMRPLDLAGQEAKAPVTLDPPVSGRWQWVGTNALTFVPETSLPRATPFSVRVAAGTRALDGTALAEDYELSFSTARPALVRTEPYAGSDDLTPSATFTLRFNQPVADAEVLRAVALSAGKSAVPFEVKRPDADNAMLVELSPRAPLPLASDITLDVDASLRGSEGPLPSGRAESFRFKTYGPLRVSRVSCDTNAPHGKCAPSGGISLSLTNQVKLADLKKAIRIEPSVAITWPSYYDEEELTRGVWLNAALSPAKNYVLRIAKGALRDEHGQPLAEEVRHQVVVDDLFPTAEIGLYGSYFEPAPRREIPIGAINVDELEVAVAALDEEAVLDLEGRGAARSRRPEMSDIEGQPGAKVTRPKPNAPKNRPWRSGIRVDSVLGGKDGRGAVAVGIAYDDPKAGRAKRTTRTAVVQVTDLAISAKLSPHGSIVRVTSLSTAAPVPGVSVSIRKPGDGPGAFLTGADGIAQIPAASFQSEAEGADRAIVFARLGSDFSYRRVDDAIYAYRFGIPVAYGEERPFGMMFTERGIYRPGDEVRIKGILRKESHPKTVTPSGERVTVKIEGPDGDDVATFDETLSAFGTFEVKLKVPQAGKLGTYAIAATVADGARGWGDVNADFEVAEYRPAEFAVEATSDRPAFIRGDTGNWTARGDFLFGAPMAGAAVRHTLTRAETWFSPPGFEEFSTSDAIFRSDLPDASLREQQIASGRTKLDDKGAAQTTEKLAMPGQAGPELVTFEAEVTDLSRQSIASSTSAIVHPAEVYLALRASKDYFVPSGSPVSPEVFAVTPEGTKVSRVAVHLDLVQRKWIVAKQKTAGSGYHSVSTPTDTVVASCDVTTQVAAATCSLTPPSGGYFLLRAKAKDARGNPVSASTSFYATGAGVSGWGDSDSGTVELVPDRKSYQVGQTARVLVKSPFTSVDALVTVERAGIYTERTMKLSGAMPTVDIPITDDMRPNAFVSVLLVRGRTKAAPADLKSPDIGLPTYRLGYATLRVDPESRRLTAAVSTDKRDYRPGEPIAVDVAVTDRAGKPARAEVTLYAVDEGVLSLIGYKTPDPIPVFMAPRPLHVTTLETRSGMGHLVNPYGELGLDKGLEGGGGGERSVRRDFRSSAFYQGALVTDDGGHVRASFKLPDSLTTYRVMAVVVAQDDRFGYGQARVTTSRPLMARPAFPRFARAGDTLDAGVIVTSKGLADATIDVEAIAEGLVLSGPAKQSIALAANSSAEVRFALAAPKAGKAKVTFRVAGGGEKDAVEVVRDVLVPLVPEAVALYGETTSASAERLGDLSAVRSDTGELTVTLSSSSLVGLDAGATQLIEYPYGCTEQLTSRLVPLFPLAELARDFGFSLGVDTKKVATQTIAKVLANQRGDGGFGMWTESTSSNGWVSSYALWGLLTAKRHGAEVPSSAIEGATRYVRRYLEQHGNDEVGLATSAFIVDVLSESGSPDPGRVSALFERRAELPLFAEAMLLHAMTGSGSDPSAVAEVVREIEGHLRLDGPVARAVANVGDRYATIMDSTARTSALVLRGLVAANPKHPLASSLVRGLLADRKGGAWRSTQETAWALLALDDYRRAQESEAPSFDARVFFGATQIMDAPFHGKSLKEARSEVPVAQLKDAGGTLLAFDVLGTGKLFYQARLRYAREAMPEKPLDRGFFVQKTIRAVSPEALTRALSLGSDASQTRYAGGDLVLGEIIVVTPSPRSFVVIDDPLPAGFEAVDARLATTAGSLDDEGGDGASGYDDDDEVAMGSAYQPSWFVRELRDDRVLFFVDHMAAGMYRYRYLARATTLGSFVLPPSRAEEMYAPEVFGRTAASRITVAPTK